MLMMMIFSREKKTSIVPTPSMCVCLSLFLSIDDERRAAEEEDETLAIKKSFDFD